MGHRWQPRRSPTRCRGCNKGGKLWLGRLLRTQRHQPPLPPDWRKSRSCLEFPAGHRACCKAPSPRWEPRRGRWSLNRGKHRGSKAGFPPPAWRGRSKGWCSRCQFRRSTRGSGFESQGRKRRSKGSKNSGSPAIGSRRPGRSKRWWQLAWVRSRSRWSGCHRNRKQSGCAPLSRS